jgi:signal transduction histidine kinase
MYVQNLLTALALLAVTGALVWFRTGAGRRAKTQRERVRAVAWCSGLLLAVLAAAGAFQLRRPDGFITETTRITVYQATPSFRPGAIRHLQPRMAVIVHPSYAPDAAYFTILSVALAAAIVLVIRPALGRRLLPLALLGLGAEGLNAARDHSPAQVRTFGSVLSGGAPGWAYYLVLPVAYGLLLLGGVLLWRTLDRSSPVTRLALGRLGDPARAGSPWALLLLPVTIMITGLLLPGTWFGGGPAGAAVTTAVVAAAALVVRRYPGPAAVAAMAGLLALAAAGLVMASVWPAWPGPRTGQHYALLGTAAVASHGVADLAAVQSVILLGMAAWLAPRAIPRLRPLPGLAPNADLVRRVQRLTESRAVAVDTAAADVRRLERDLHDGAQARLVALGMHLRAVEKLIPVSPDAALALVAEARETSARALTELRELVRGVHPPVLADRGLGDAIRALALDTPLRIDTEVLLPGRLPAPIETACYFAVAEILTNVVKHSGAREARICVTHADDMLRITVTDYGLGGADAARGSGLAGVERRLATFDGILAVSSPAGGPTMIVMEMPCASLAPKVLSY